MTIKTDALIIGAGPCGLFQIFELGLLGIKAHIVDSLNHPGGQCTELYPDKPIYDIPAVPVCTGQELTEALLKQIEPFHATFHLGEQVTVVRPEEDGFYVETSAGTKFHAKTVFIAAGVGSFTPRKLRFPEAEALEGKQLHYRVNDPQQFAGQRLVVLGGGDSALDWAVELAPKAASLTLVHRRDEFRGAEATANKLRELAAQGRAEIVLNANAAGLELDENGRLVAVTIRDNSDGETRRIEADQLLVFFGLSPKLGPIADWGLDLNRKTINVDTATFQTNIPGIFAIGDIADYPGKKKLILSGFHEAALAAFAAKAIIEPGKKVPLQYTTTSPIMHKRLGVEESED
ncbi:MAG: NAD(P)/FAD-dependent oxidoreductase [Gammaproteobacteria bacterium]|nr:MAG: NAD(P)/FAD-dependent oxidoreductase [Gammaproteobacteria bacterium]